ncbi:MAG: multicopper oxidase family protein [Dermatophilaceae bacterium]
MALGRRWRRLAAAAAAAALVLPLGWLWKASLLPSTYSVMDRGYLDHGGGPARETASGHEHTGGIAPGRSVSSLTGPANRAPDVDVTLVARKQGFRLASGESIDGYTLNGSSPGPELRAVKGQLVQVKLVNESVPDGITLHWHGLDVPNAEDGVAGVTQDAVLVGESYTYRFIAGQAGSFWYHSHQLSHEQVLRGLLGPLVITPPTPEARNPRGAAAPPVAGAEVDEVALVHLYGGVRTVNGRSGDIHRAAPAGSRARVRVINTDNGPMGVWVNGAPYRLVAVDGTDLHGSTPVTDAAVQVTAGGRADLELQLPSDGSEVRVELGGSAALVLGPEGASDGSGVRAGKKPPKTLDLLTYGTPAPLAFDPVKANRRFDFVVGRRPGFVGGRPGLWWTINGHLFPDVPMFVVAKGDVVRMHVENQSGEVHPMHLHGHHAVVLSRNGVAARGSPWWVDSLNVANGESYEIAFVADNPGVWMDHCHNLPHAAQGLVAHLMYEGVTEPLRVGGSVGNQPE